MAYQTKRSREQRMRTKERFNAIKNGDEFAKMTFIQLKKDDSTWNRFLRALGLKKRQTL